MKLRLIETRLLTVKNNVNVFHGNERTYAIQSRHNNNNNNNNSSTPRRRRRRRRLLDDDDNDEEEQEQEQEQEQEEEEVPLFTIHSFIHIQASVEVEGVEEQMLIFSSSLTPGRVKGSRIALI